MSLKLPTLWIHWSVPLAGRLILHQSDAGGHSSWTQRFSSPVMFKCLRLFSHPNCHSVWSHQRKGFALCPSRKGKKKLSVFPPSMFPLYSFTDLRVFLTPAFLLPPIPYLCSFFFSPTWPNQPGIEVTIKDEDEEFVLYLLPATLRTGGQTPWVEQILFAQYQSRTGKKKRLFRV